MNFKVPYIQMNWSGINTVVPAKWVVIGLSNDMLFIQHHSVT